MSRSQRIQSMLTEKLNPVFLEVNNESHKHHVPKDSETHFKLVIVSEHFQAMSKIERHRLINKILAEELQQGLHALSLHLHTPEEWQLHKEKIPASPACRDGYRNG